MDLKETLYSLFEDEEFAANLHAIIDEVAGTVLCVLHEDEWRIGSMVAWNLEEKKYISDRALYLKQSSKMNKALDLLQGFAHKELGEAVQGYRQTWGRFDQSDHIALVRAQNSQGAEFELTLGAFEYFQMNAMKKTNRDSCVIVAGSPSPDNTYVDFIAARQNLDYCSPNDAQEFFIDHMLRHKREILTERLRQGRLDYVESLKDAVEMYRGVYNTKVREIGLEDIV